MTPRLATIGDLPALVELIPVSARELSRGFYTEAQTEAAIRYVFGPDTRLISDGTYFIVEENGTLAGCGGWSRRRTLYGGDQTKAGEEAPPRPPTPGARGREESGFFPPSRLRPPGRRPRDRRRLSGGGARRRLPKNRARL